MKNKPTVISVVGARPQFIKVRPIDRALRVTMRHLIIHTGQHYDDRMSGVFFKQLNIPKPLINLNIGSGSHGQQTGNMLIALERVFLKLSPDLIIVYGDTNSTLAAALAATKLHIPVAHIEAGMRSYNRLMPEEINRVLTDHLSELHFCASRQAVTNLKNEGITKGVYFVGDVMFDVLRRYIPFARKNSTIIHRLGIEKGKYFLSTIHRAGNTDQVAYLEQILRGLKTSTLPVILPAHPRLIKTLRNKKLRSLIRFPLIVIPPADYLDMLCLEDSAKAILTDSGGVQKEAYFLGKPCITLRLETEWVETVSSGWNRLTGHSASKIQLALRRPPRGSYRRLVYGRGYAAETIVRHIHTFLLKIRRQTSK